ncbi:TVP38/TMEM64 family protein [Desulfospira joergensenii]|uniref:TVP38/TMEM64 family protein n=1 Tax=Desulfospira joergensenii TaxID=53329 RepID=UPI0003B3FBD8|nr:TVP38/TMEM64 family protein [Desulfospira joergensenii]
MKKNVSRGLVIGAIVLLFVLFFVLDLSRYLSLEYIKSQQEMLLAFYRENTMATIGIFMGIYILVTGLSLPGAAVMTLASGTVFGLFTGTVVVSFASTIGATLAFVVSRFLLRDWVQARFKDKLRAINQGISKEGEFYLFTLRLVPVFPFFIINLVMGLTPITTFRFYLVSQIGMLAGTLVYVNAGTQLGQIDSLKGIVSPGLLLSFALLGCFPLLAKKGVSLIKKERS